MNFELAIIKIDVFETGSIAPQPHRNGCADSEYCCDNNCCALGPLFPHVYWPAAILASCPVIGAR